MIKLDVASLGFRPDPRSPNIFTILTPYQAQIPVKDCYDTTTRILIIEILTTTRLTDVKVTLNKNIFTGGVQEISAY